ADLPGFIDMLHRVLEGEKEQMEVVVDDRTFDTVVSPSYDEQGRICGGVGISIDVTEEREALRIATEHKQLLDTALDGAPMVLYAFDADGTITFSQGRALESIGFSDGELVGANVRDFNEPGSPGDEATTKVLAGERTVWISHFGSEVFEVTAIPTEAGGAVAVSNRITERVQGEQTLRETVSALAEARDEAEAANRAKSAFLAAMSHEIRTPMNAVIGFGDLLKTTALTPQQQSYVRTIQNAGDRLLGLIDDLLDFSKIEAGRLPIETEPLDTEPLIVHALEEVATLAAKKGLELAYIIREGVPARVIGDPRRIGQILANLLSNAIKFTEKGGVEVHVGLRDDHQLAVTVQDTGIGIDPARIERVFEAFVQADESTARRFGGTGLGLAISRRLAEAMGGDLTATSVPGQGSAFTLSLPLPTAPETGRVVLHTATTSLSGSSVLLVDDDEISRLGLSTRLQQWGMTVSATHDPAEALAWIDSGQSFDLGVLDMVMPETDGLQLAAAIRERRSPQTLPLVVLSSEPEARHAPDLVVSTICKPITPVELHDLLSRALATRETLPSATVLDPATQAALEEKAIRVAPLGVRRILLAEDEPDNQLLAVRMLSELGFSVEVATTGVEALERLRQHPYDVVLMDVMMPAMDGLEATRRLRAELPPEQQPRVIALTARAMAADREACFNAGMDDFLAKPFRMAALAKVLDRGFIAEA
ncbi:MAG: response regulator, partial [Bacteroidota bacterium]